MTTHKAIVRIRPLLPGESPAAMTLSPTGIHLAAQTRSLFTPCPILLPATSSLEDLYIPIAPFVAQVAKGFNAAVVVYGDTGSGKTYSLYGSERGGLG